MTRTSRTSRISTGRRTWDRAHGTGAARLALAGISVVLIAGVTACGASAADDKDPDHRSFGLQGRTLTIDSDDSALEVVADEQERGKIEVTRWFQGTVAVGSDPEVTWSMKDDRLTLRVNCSGMVADCSAKHRIEVPRGIAVKVESGDGSVRAKGFRDALSLRTKDGSVHVTDTSGPLQLRTGDGSVRAEVSSRTVRARTGDGSVRLELGAVPDRVDTRTGDGSLTIELPRAAYRVTTDTGDGAEDVSVPRDDSSSHEVTARTGDGKLTVRTAN
ncbi:DUF4097 domain-containing protein [Streptomyces sp. 15-116A]|uniref:DUF4097 domain-containing protein n=1 Tax=Streptomyces sp. 15-116A TaxID=2259035 RepID=UPI0021B3CE4C|nr:DUF4097 domain-containing protein [Streptomyces sp. 15-116A]MCT7356765.1 DUF4097 domain-containing protein [Streptomyces sp. 15-116A]